MSAKEESLPPNARTMDAKVVVLGGQGVGKTSLVVRYVQGTFLSDTKSTIGASFFTHKMTLDNCRVKLTIWDTAGQERFRAMAPMYYRGASAALLVYDVTSPSSFEDIQGWVRELRKNINEDICLCVIANKVDLRDAGESLPTEIGRKFAQSISALFYETSAKDNTGINDAFLKITQELLKARGLLAPTVASPSIRPSNSETSIPAATEKPCCN